MVFTRKYAYRTTSVKIKPSETMPVENNFPTSKQIESNNFIVVLAHFTPVFTFISIPPSFSQHLQHNYGRYWNEKNY